MQKSGSVDTSTAGTSSITYTVNDAAGNSATATRTVIVSTSAVVDTTPPVITITGSQTVNLTVGDSYTDAGATATDETDGDLTSSISASGSVDTSTAGTSSITYTVNDAAGNSATATRTVIVSVGAISITDQDGNSYSLVTIGSQVWTTENAQTTSYNDGTPIPQVQDKSTFRNLTTGAWRYLVGDQAYGEERGKTYNIYALLGKHDDDPNTPNKTFAPSGFHVSTAQDWDDMLTYLANNGYNSDGTTGFSGGDIANNSLAKSIASDLYWTSGALGSNLSTNNTSGFNAFPHGQYSYTGNSRPDNGDNEDKNEWAQWWTTTPQDGPVNGVQYYKYRWIFSSLNKVWGHGESRYPNEAHLVRFVKD